jgi:hypothetical protein
MAYFFLFTIELSIKKYRKIKAGISIRTKTKISINPYKLKINLKKI